MSAITVNRGTAGGADFSAYLGRVVYETDADTVDLSDDPTTEVPLGVIHAIDPSGTRVEVCVDGMSRVRVGAAGITGQVGFIAAANDAGDATQDGKVVAATAGDFYVGRALARVDSSPRISVPGIPPCSAPCSVTAGPYPVRVAGGLALGHIPGESPGTRTTPSSTASRGFTRPVG